MKVLILIHCLTATDWIWSDKDSIKRWDRTKYFVNQTLKFMRDQKGKPCFVNLWPDDVHTPWVPKADESYTGNFPMGQEDEASFKLVLKEFDLQIGRLVAGLAQMGELENTIIVFTSDNGALPSFRGSRNGGLRGSKLSLYEGGTRMPFIITWPGKIPEGKVDNGSEVSALDLLPSLAKMAGVKLPLDYKGDGIDRSAVLTGKPSPRNKAMFWEYGRNSIAYKFPKPVDRSPALAVRSGEWKLLMNSDGSDVQLYNIAKDKNETTNLNNQQVAVTKKLKLQLAEWWESLPRLK